MRMLPPIHPSRTVCIPGAPLPAHLVTQGFVRGVEQHQGLQHIAAVMQGPLTCGDSSCHPSFPKTWQVPEDLPRQAACGSGGDTNVPRTGTEPVHFPCGRGTAAGQDSGGSAALPISFLLQGGEEREQPGWGCPAVPQRFLVGCGLQTETHSPQEPNTKGDMGHPIPTRGWQAASTHGSRHAGTTATTQPHQHPPWGEECGCWYRKQLSTWESQGSAPSSSQQCLGWGYKLPTPLSPPLHWPPSP